MDRATAVNIGRLRQLEARGARSGRNLEDATRRDKERKEERGARHSGGHLVRNTLTVDVEEPSYSDESVPALAKRRARYEVCPWNRGKKYKNLCMRKRESP